MIRLNRIKEGDERLELYASNDIEAVLAWSETFGNTELTGMLRGMKSTRSEGKRLAPITARLEPDLEIIIS
jgi:hypothetical protein